MASQPTIADTQNIILKNHLAKWLKINPAKNKREALKVKRFLYSVTSGRLDDYNNINEVGTKGGPTWMKPQWFISCIFICLTKNHDIIRQSRSWTDRIDSKYHDSLIKLAWKYLETDDDGTRIFKIIDDWFRLKTETITDNSNVASK